MKDETGSSKGGRPESSCNRTVARRYSIAGEEELAVVLDVESVMGFLGVGRCWRMGERRRGGDDRDAERAGCELG